MAGAMKWDEQWAEAFALLFLVLGFVVSILLQSAYFTSLSVFLAGLIGGRIYYLRYQTQPIFPFVLMIVGFLLGYLLGNFWTSRLLTLFFFALGFIGSYYIHQQKIIGTFKSENFVK